MRFAHVDVRDHIVSLKTTTRRRSGAMDPRNNRDAQKPTFARFLAS
jgi:hypothetical protein